MIMSVINWNQSEMAAARKSDFLDIGPSARAPPPPQEERAYLFAEEWQASASGH
jgi:hypothetical protein